MLAVTAETVQAADFVALLVGVLVALALAIVLVSSGQWRNPLAGCIPPGSSDYAWPGVLAGLFAYVAAVQIAILALRGDATAEMLARAGSDAWHRMQSADAIGKLVAAVIMMGFLLAARPPVAARPRTSWRVLAAVVVCGALASTSITMLQLYAGKTIWHWFQPEVAQPVHQVLVAMKDSEWNRAPAIAPWGTIQLWIGAVVVAPLAEELFFRGVLLAGVHRASGHTWLSVASTSLLFGVIHGAQPQDILPLAVFGGVLAFVRVRYRSLTACMLIHALFNLRTMIQVTLAPELIDA